MFSNFKKRKPPFGVFHTIVQHLRTDGSILFFILSMVKAACERSRIKRVSFRIVKDTARSIVEALRSNEKFKNAE